MSVTVIVGTQWGDEGKGKVTDYYASEADYIVRFQGGNNAGHTIVAGGRTYKFHLLPSGIIYPDKKVVLGNGMVVDPRVLREEIDTLEGMGDSHAPISISDRATVIMPYHRTQDALEEAMRGANKIGTTLRGIGPAYTDKVARHAIKMGDLVRYENFRDKLDYALRFKKAQLQGYMTVLDSEGAEYDREAVKDSLDAEKILEEFREHSAYYSDMVTDTATLLHNAYSRGENILLEGAQGTLLDIDHGTVPYVTSSNTVSGMASIGSGLPPNAIDKVVGIVKAYTTRVGDGPFPTELNDDTGRHMAEKGAEFGTTTGRPRRCGWLDIVLLRYAARVNGLTHIAITKLDVLCGLKEVKVCTAYELDGDVFDVPPSHPSNLERVSPSYVTMPGWDFSCESETVRRGVEALPENARNYINYIADSMGVEVDLVSLGPEREMTIDLRKE